MVQFNHRMMAYLLAVVVILHAVDVLRSVDHHDAMAGALTLVALVGIQAAHWNSDAGAAGADRARAGASGDGGGAAHDRGAACGAAGGEAAAR